MDGPLPKTEIDDVDDGDAYDDNDDNERFSYNLRFFSKLQGLLLSRVCLNNDFTISVAVIIMMMTSMMFMMPYYDDHHHRHNHHHSHRCLSM